MRQICLCTEIQLQHGSLCMGQEAVKEGLIDQVGGIREALKKLNELIEKKKKL